QPNYTRFSTIEGSTINNMGRKQTSIDCCCLTALECYRSNLLHHFNSTHEKPVRKLIRGLKSEITVSQTSLNKTHVTIRVSKFTCVSFQSTCQVTCEKHPQRSAKEFLERLESLIQRVSAFSNLKSVSLF
uniref:Uncharacterized protein n=1 Tax=Neogobius melanostomus TaxID=47308 RepID=A0A8C6SMB9_9GOBI